MMLKLLFRSTLAVLASVLPGLCAGANDSGFSLYPVPAVFTSQGGDANAARIDPDFAVAVPGERGGKYFSDSFRDLFPESVSVITAANKRRTFAVSMQVARASKYVVEKPDGTSDVYLPITGSIYFTNVMTGEVLFTFTRTEITQVTLRRDATATGSSQIQSYFRQNFDELVTSLVKTARSQFHPKSITAIVRGEWKGLAVLDGGRDQGLSRDDTLSDPDGNEVRVISAGPRYAIARLELGKFVRGGKFSKVSNQTLAEILKPRVLPLVDKTPQDLPEQTIVQILSDALGAKSSISLTPVNRTYQAVLTTIAAKADISQDAIRQRELPNFFFRLNVPEPIEFEAPTNLAHKTRRVYEAMALAELVDRSGRVLWAGIGENHIEDEVTAGIAFNSSARREVVIKNALLDLANRFGKEMKFSSAEVAVTSGGSEPSLRDDHGMLAKGASNLFVYRNIGKVEGIDSDVRVPIWSINVSSVTDGSAGASLDLPVVEGAPEPVAGDVVFLSGVSRSGLVTHKRFGPCPEQKLGSVEISGYGDIARNIFASRFKATYITQGLSVKVAELVRSGSGFKGEIKAMSEGADYCVEPVYRVDLVEPTCTGDVCADIATVRLTYRLRIKDATGDIKVRQGLETKMTTGALPRKTSEATRKAALRADLLDEVVKLNSSMIPSLSKETY